MPSPSLIESTHISLMRAQVNRPWLEAGAPCCGCDVEPGCKSNYIWIIGSRPRVTRLQTDSFTRVLLNARSIMSQHDGRGGDCAMCCVLISRCWSVSRVESTAVVSHILYVDTISKAPDSWMQAQTHSRYRLCYAARPRRGPSLAGSDRRYRMSRRQ